MAPAPETVTNGFKSSALIAERSRWQHAKLTTEQLDANTYRVQLANSKPGDRQYLIKILLDNSAIAYTAAPDAVLERPVGNTEVRPGMALAMSTINNPAEVSMELAIPQEFTTSSIPKKPFINATKTLDADWKMAGWSSQEEALKGAQPTTSSFYFEANGGLANPTQSVFEAEAVARFAAQFSPAIGSQVNTVVTGNFGELD